MKTWADEVCQSKALIRPELFSVGNRFKRKPAKTFMCNPADLCLCVKEAFRQGIIDENTKVLALERGPGPNTKNEWGQTLSAYERREELDRIVDCIHTEFQMLGIKDYTIWQDSVEFLYSHKMKKMGFGHIDYAYLDTCSCLSRKFLDWYINHMNDVINYKSTLAFTFMMARDIEAWKYHRVSKEYFFSLDRKRGWNCNKLANTILDNTKFKSTVTYGRAYKEKGISAPMITFKINFGWKQGYASGCISTQDLGYN